MKMTGLLLLVLVACLCSLGHCEFEERFLTQTLNPIDLLDSRTWQNLYYIDEDYYVSGGPIYLLVGGSDFYSTPSMLQLSHFFDVGREQHALLIASEHRFYGRSRPTVNTSVENLQYLDTRYAVEDLANLIFFLKNQYDNAPVVTHGFDHGGALAVWLAQAYPHLVVGTWASAATLVAVKDFGEYLVNTGESVFRVGGPGCYNQLDLAFRQMEFYYATGTFDILEEQFNLCSPLTPGNNVEAGVFFGGFALIVGTILRLSHFYGIEQMCASLSNAEDPMRGLTNFIMDFFPECVGIDAFAALDVYRNEDWDTEATEYGARQLSFQICREFGWFRASSHLNQPFGNRFPVELFQDQCQFLFGEMFDASSITYFMDDFNQIFGGLSPNITNAYFTDGDLDPSKTLGILQSFHASVDVDIIPRFAAGGEIFSESIIADTPEILAIKEKARNHLIHWVMDRT